MSRSNGCWLITILLVLPPFLGYFNYRTVKLILGLRPDPLAKSIAETPLQSTPLFLVSREPELLSQAQDHLVQAGFNPATIRALPQQHDLEIPITWVKSANPYPPLLAEFSSGYDRQWTYLSFGYLDKEGGYHQLTYYGGEADTTPSFLVPKVRGSSTEYGDYFVGYLFRFSGEVGRQPEVIADDGTVSRWREPRVMLADVTWRTYRGGSSDAKEEILFTSYATIIEIVLIGCIIGLVSLVRVIRSNGEEER